MQSRLTHDFIASEIGPNFVDAPIISNAEVVFLMKKLRQERDKSGMGQQIGGTNQIGEELQRKTEKYVTKFNVFEQDDTIKTIRREIQKFPDIPEIESIMLWNLTPGSYEEAVTLIPSLKERPEETVNYLIEFINKNKV